MWLALINYQLIREACTVVLSVRETLARVLFSYFLRWPNINPDLTSYKPYGLINMSSRLLGHILNNPNDKYIHNFSFRKVSNSLKPFSSNIKRFIWFAYRRNHIQCRHISNQQNLLVWYLWYRHINSLKLICLLLKS